MSHLPEWEAPAAAREPLGRVRAGAVRLALDDGFHGSPRLHLEPAKAHQVFVRHGRVIGVTQREGLRARVRKRFKCGTMSEHDQPTAPPNTPWPPGGGRPAPPSPSTTSNAGTRPWGTLPPAEPGIEPRPPTVGPEGGPEDDGPAHP